MAINNNPFTIPAPFTTAHLHTAFAALRDPATHADAFNALLALLNTNPHVCKNDMERYWLGYVEDNNIWDLADAERVDPGEYMGLTNAESLMLFPEPDIG